MTTEEIKNGVEKALEEIRPFLISDGGDISLIDIEDGKHVKVRLEGACTSCSLNFSTLKAGVETISFDRGGNLYHGRVKSLAEGAREAGLKF